MQMSEDKIESIINYFKDKPVLKAYLLGSYVRNEAKEDSDIDILVDLDYEEKIGLLFVKMKSDLKELLKSKVDIVSSNGLSRYIKPSIEKEKLLIYVR